MTEGLVFDLEQREKDPEVLWKGLYYKALRSYLREDMRAMREQVEAMVKKTGNCENLYSNEDLEYYDELDFHDGDLEYDYYDEY